MRLFHCLCYCTIFLISCQTSPQITEPSVAVDDFVLQDNLKIEVIAAEPLIEAPVAMTFDHQGRIWVLEMPDYMPNIHGSDEDAARGRILILEDQNNNGRMDKAKVFLDNLKQPRALALVYGGLLYAEPPNLWFVDIKNDLPENPVLVDSTFAVGGNVEHQPNGLLMNIDNWIYNAKSNFRYRRIDGVWHKDITHYRGQWGISQDDYGRLFYNDNSNPLFGDVVQPNQLIRHQYLEPEYGLGQNICEDRRVFPLHATAVNRGYLDGVLDEEGKLIAFTSACSPLIYRGDNFEESYQSNAFVCAPEANLIKRIVLEENDLQIVGKQAYRNKEWLATTDEGFRPVALNNAPDGSMYIADMHRGIIQHKVYMTVYLKEQIEEKQLDTIYNAGRIYRVFQKNAPNTNIHLESLDNTALCQLLQHKNGWYRDQAQQLLIFRKATDIIPNLQKIAIDNTQHLAQLHALWTLDGLNALTADLLLDVHGKEHPQVSMTRIRLLEPFVKKNTAQYFPTMEQYFQLQNRGIDIQLALSISQINEYQKTFPFFHQIQQQYSQDTLVAEAIVSSLSGQEQAFLDFLKTEKKDAPQVLKNKIATVLKNIEEELLNPIYIMQKTYIDDKTVGRDLFNIHCAACHGIGGEGRKNLAPSLFKATLVDSDADAVASIILHGLKGPIQVGEKTIKFNAAMPGLKDNTELTDEDIAAITAYVKNAFSSTSQGMTTERVGELRQLQPKEKLFTEEELMDLQD